MHGKKTTGMAVKELLFRPFGQGYQSYRLREAVDWQWLDSQRGKVNLNFQLDCEQQSLEFQQVIFLGKYVMRKRKRCIFFHSTTKGINILRPQDVTARWKSVHKGTEFSLHFRRQVDADAKLKQIKQQQHQ